MQDQRFSLSSTMTVFSGMQLSLLLDTFLNALGIVCQFNSMPDTLKSLCGSLFWLLLFLIFSCNHPVWQLLLLAGKLPYMSASLYIPKLSKHLSWHPLMTVDVLLTWIRCSHPAAMSHLE